MEVFRILALALSGLVAVLYFYQTVYLFLPKLRRPSQIPPLRTVRGRYAVLIAARNEEAVLPYLLDSIRAQAYPAELIDVYVAADNCTDGTAAAARRLGAAVYERRDLRHIGKGYALAFLIDSIRRSGRLEDYDAFLVFDADNLLEPDYIAAMDKTFAQGFEAVCGYRAPRTSWTTGSPPATVSGTPTTAPTSTPPGWPWASPAL